MQDAQMHEYIASNDQINHSNQPISSIKAQLNKNPKSGTCKPYKIKIFQNQQLIKLIPKDQIYIIPQQKPNDKFGKKRLKSTKTPIFYRFEIFPICMTKMHET